MPTLDWLNRDAAFRSADQVPYRLLQAVSTHGSGDDIGNLLVQGDNLKALLPLYRAQVKCIFIDPPYNSKSAFEHNDDNLEHSEAHHFKVLADEVFRRGFVIADIAWKRRDGAPNDREIGPVYDHVLVYSRSIGDGLVRVRVRVPARMPAPVYS